MNPMIQTAQIQISIADLFAPESIPAMATGDPVEIAAQVARRYQFLPQPVIIGIRGDQVLIEFRDATDRQKAEAARLAKRAAKHACKGDCQRAINLRQRVIQLMPHDLAARRDLGTAYSELGDFSKAKQYLCEALRIDPDDAASIVTLAKIAIVQKDYARAESQARQAVAADPQSAVAQYYLGAVLFFTQRQDAALTCFRAAVGLDPTYAPPYGGMAYLLHRQGRNEEAETTLRDMFTKAQHQDARSEVFFTQADKLFFNVQKTLAQARHVQAGQMVEAFSRAIEDATGLRRDADRRLVKAVVIDFKTDKVKTLEILQACYTEQVNIYRPALAAALKIDPAQVETVLISTHLSQLLAL